MAQDASKAIPRTLCISGLVTTLLLSTALTTPTFAGGGASGGFPWNASGGEDQWTGPGSNGEPGPDCCGGGGGGAGEIGGRGGDVGTWGGDGGSAPGANGDDGSTDIWGSGSGGGGGAHGFVGSELPTFAVKGGDGGNGGQATDEGAPWAKPHGGGGGAGGYGAVVIGNDAHLWDALWVNSTGGNGGAGGDGNATSEGGSGGSGGIGLLFGNNAADWSGFSFNGMMTGGDGGAGGANLGNGGDGGAGLYLSNAESTGVALWINNAATGGNGGAAGSNGGAGGNGGAGITVSQALGDPAPVWLDIYHTVTGGNGGAAGSNSGLAGLGGVGVEGSQLFITMWDGGSIAGGMSGDSLTQANAINFTGGDNILTFTGATSQLSGNIDVAQDASVRLVSFPADGTVVDNVITGGGAVQMSWSGFITLTGANTYSGGTSVSAESVLKLSGAGTLGAASGKTTVNNATLDLGGTTQTQVRVDLGGNGTIRSGKLNAAIYSTGGTIKDIGGTASLTTTWGTTTMLGTNNYSGATVVDYGTLNVLGVLSDTSSVEVNDGGKLKVQGVVTGTPSVDVNGGGLLGGNGFINAPVVRINNGGIIAPGNSIGTLTIGGALTLAAGSTYQVEIAGDGRTDLIDVSGKATVAGSHVAVTALDPEASYKTGHTYRILTAGDGVVGTFAEAATESVFLDLALVHTANAVDLTVKLKNAGPVFGTVAETRNQVATADALDGLQQSGPQLALYNSLLMLGAEQARASFDQLSGEIHASAKGVMIEDSRFARDAAMDRLRDAFDAVGAVRSPVATYVDGKPVLAAASTEGFAFWGRGFGSWGHWDGDGNAATIKRDIGGFFAGGDGIVADTWRVGVLGGYSRSTFNVEDRYSAGSSDNYHVGLYGGTQWGDLAVRTGAAYTWHKVSTDRVVAFPGFADSLTADYNARTAQAFGELGYGIQAGGVALEPFANLAYVSLATDGFGEKGGAAALTSDSSTSNATFTTLGARAATSFSLGTTTATAKGTLGWRHAYGDVSPVSQMRFAGGDTFSVAGVPIARDVAWVKAGLDFALSPGAVLGVSYGGQFGSGLSDQSVKANFNVKF